MIIRLSKRQRNSSISRAESSKRKEDTGPRPKEYAVDRDSKLRRRLLRQFDRGATDLHSLLGDRFGEERLDKTIELVREEYEQVIDRLPWIGGSANPRSFSLYGSAIWLALWRVLQPQGLTLDEVRELFCELFRAYWSRYPRILARAYGRSRMGPANQKKVERIALISQQRLNPNDYVSEFVPGEPGRFDFGIDFVECGIIKFLRSEGAEELAPVLCELDWPHMDVLGIKLIRTATLAQGADRCDFRFLRLGATDIGQPRTPFITMIAYGVAGWAAGAALKGGLAALAPLTIAPIVYAISAPIVFCALTLHLIVRSGGHSPIVLAGVFTATVIAFDALLVSSLIERNVDIYLSVLRTWLPYALIFVTVFMAGKLIRPIINRRTIRE